MFVRKTKYTGISPVETSSWLSIRGFSKSCLLLSRLYRVVDTSRKYSTWSFFLYTCFSRCGSKDCLFNFAHPFFRESFYISFFFNLTIYSAAFSSASIAASLTAFILHWKFQTATKTMKIKLINIITEVDKEVFCLTLNLNHDITNMIRPITRTGTHFEYTLDHCCPPIPRNTWSINMCAFMHPKLRCVIYLNELLLNKRYYLVSGKIIGLYKYFRIGIEWNLSFVVCHLFTMSCLVKRSPSPHVTLSSGSISQTV